MAGLNTLPVLNALESHAAGLGVFERVNTHEPKSAPAGLTCAIWAGSVRPARSGLAATSARVEWIARIYQNMLSDPPDAIDRTVLIAVDLLFTAVSADFTLGGTVEAVDLLGKDGEPLRAEGGYIQMDGRMYRVMTLFIPVTINDVWNQEA